VGQAAPTGKSRGMYLMLLDLVAPGRVCKSALGSPCTHHQHGTQALSVRAGKTFCSAYQKEGRVDGSAQVSTCFFTVKPTSGLKMA
jgi:hypothetical protein